MEKFFISPDDCLILKAFRDSGSLREAAALLGCDPAGLARQVQRISSEHGFLQKVNNRWQVTARGLDLVVWAEASIQSQKRVVEAKSSLRIATTTWFGEEVVVPNMASLRATLAGSPISLSVPDKGFELALVDGSVDFVIVCHPPENPEIEHRQIGEEEWRIVAPAAWRRELKAKDAFSSLKSRPFIRHAGMNQDLFLPDAPPLLDSGITIDNLIGVRAAVRAGLGWSLVPKILTKREVSEGRIIELTYDLPIRDRRVCLWWLRHRSDTRKLAGKISAWAKEIIEAR